MIGATAAFLLSITQGAGELVLREPSVPSQLETTLSAKCEGKTILIRFSTARPGPDFFSAIEVDGIAVRALRIGQLSDMLRGKDIEKVTIASCAQGPNGFEARVHLSFGGAQDMQHVLLGIKNGETRIIRNASEL